jgi:ubiquinone/menaquinone biosynthesis C-methylase UbiE
MNIEAGELSRIKPLSEERPMKNHQEKVTEQFSGASKKYLNSAVHAQGKDLEALKEKVYGTSPSLILDLGCGAGHVSYHLALLAKHVIAMDPSEAMLQVVQEEALSRHLPNIETKAGHAEKIPFENGQFDLVVSRYSAHHWEDLERSLQECSRVLRPGGKILMIDSISPEMPLKETWLQTIELLRDTTHVKSYRLSDWKGAINEADFLDITWSMWKTRLLFDSWIQRSSTPENRTTMIRHLFDIAPSEVRAYFDVSPDGDFSIDSMMIEGTKRTG